MNRLKFCQRFLDQFWLFLLYFLLLYLFLLSLFLFLILYFFVFVYFFVLYIFFCGITLRDLACMFVMWHHPVG